MKTKEYKLSSKDLTVQRNLNGSLAVSTIYRDHLVTRVYYGYSQREAKRLFLEHIEAI